jgi:hypothetical protein
MAANRVGVSARFDDLHDTPHPLHCAKVTLRGCGDRASRVAVFDGSVLATAVVSAPEIMVKSVGDALDGFRELGETRTARSSSTRFGCGRTTTPCASRRNSLLFIPTPCDTDSGESRSTPAGPFRGHVMSRNYVWHSRCIAG